MPTINKPSLRLTFLGGDLETGHLGVQTVTDEHIIRRSVTFHYQLLSGLKSASNQVSMLLDKDCPSIEDIIATEGDIKAVLKDGTETLFTGYLSTNFSWAVTESGKQALEITLEDIGTRLLGKAFITRGHHLFNCSASEAIRTICSAAGVSMSASCLPLLDTITKEVDSDTSCRELLDQLVYELGHVYHFDELGQLRLFKVDCTSTGDIPVLDRDDLHVVGGKAITLGKKIRQYRSARVTFTRLGSASDYLVYRNTTGRGEGHPYCYMKIGPGEHFDGAELYTALEWEEAQMDSLRDPALIEACNAESEILIVGSNRIISVSNVREEFTAQSGSVSCSIKPAGGPYLKIEAHNSGGLPYYITRMDAYADILYVRDTNIVRTADSAYEGESSDNLLSEDLSFVHTRDLAQSHANLLGQYHRHCNAQYGFYSKRDIALGSVIRLVDNVFSGLVVNVLVTAKSYTDESDIIGYQAVGISAFDLTAPTYLQVLNRGKNDTVGQTGAKGEDGSSFTVCIESTNGSVFRPGQADTTLCCRVYLNTTEVTEALEASRFRWRRVSSDQADDLRWNTSSKAIGHKCITVTPADCTGRTVFFCEIDLAGYEP